MRFCVTVVVLLCLSLSCCFANPTADYELHFNEQTKVICPAVTVTGSPGTATFSLVMGEWPTNSPAQDFVIHISSFFNSGSTFVASLDPNVNSTNYSWTTIEDPSFLGLKELWIPQQPVNTTVYVFVECEIKYITATFAMKPSIPADVPATSTPNLFSDSQAASIGNWYAFNLHTTAALTRAAIKSEVCSKLVVSYLYTRVVFPNINSTTTCDSTDGQDGSSNCGIMDLISSTVSIETGGLFYFFVGSLDTSTNFVPVDWNFYIVTTDAGNYYTWTVTPPIATGLKVNKDLIIADANSFDLFPADVPNIKLFYDSPTDSINKPLIFESSCWLKSSVGQKYNYNGKLVNSSTDSQMLKSSFNGFKAPGFYDNTKYSPYLSSFAILVNDYVTITFDNPNEVIVPNTGMLVAVIGLSIFSAISLITIIGGYVMFNRKMKQLGYATIR